MAVFFTQRLLHVHSVKNKIHVNIFLADHQAKQQRLIAEVYVQPDAKVTTFSIALPGNETRVKVGNIATNPWEFRTAKFSSYNT